MFGDKGYGPEVDWWSIGTILFEMVIGFPPFYSENSKETCKKIMNWRKHLKFPSNVKVSDEVKDLMIGLINDVDKRLGYNGSEEIKRHPWFKDIDWNNLSLMKPPYVPRVSSDCDVKYFETFQEKPNQPFHHVDGKKKNVEKDVCFLDFSFDKKSSSDIRLIDFFEQIEEGFKCKKVREMSSDIKPSYLFNINSNFQLNLSETAFRSSNNLKDKNAADLIKPNKFINSAITERQNTSSNVTIEVPSVLDQFANSPKPIHKSQQTNNLTSVKDKSKTKMLPFLESKKKSNMNVSTSMTKPKIDLSQSSKILPSNLTSSNLKSVKEQSQSKISYKDEMMKTSKIKQIEVDKYKILSGNVTNLKMSSLSPRESLLSTAIGFKSPKSNFGNLKILSSAKQNEGMPSNRIKK